MAGNPDWLDNILASLKQYGGSIFQPSPPANPDYEKYPSETEWVQKWGKSAPQGWYDQYGKPTLLNSPAVKLQKAAGWSTDPIIRKK